MAKKAIQSSKSKPKKPAIVVVVGSDWEGLYIDGKLRAEGHSISKRDVFEALEIEYKSITADDDWLMDCGSLPQNLSEVKSDSGS